jgi:hypothetical protein
MKFYRKYLLISVVSLVSCEKVIDIDIREADRKIVIEGIATNEGDCEVKITRSVHFSDPSIFPPVTGAHVLIRGNGGVLPLLEISPGIYRPVNFNGIPGNLYELEVYLGSQLFKASSRMFPPVPIDTMYVAPGPFGSYLFPHVQYTDPAGIDNAYRFVQYKNRLKDPAIFWDDDEFTNGQTNLLRLDNGVSRNDDPRALHSGDTVMVELLSLDDPIYRFWSTVQFGGAAGSAFTASPANPITNIQGGALGYFSAHSVTRRSVIVP